MNINLSPTSEEIIRRQLASGTCASATDVVDYALQLLDEQTVEETRAQEELSKLVQLGLDELHAGRVGSLDIPETIRRGIELADSQPRSR